MHGSYSYVYVDVPLYIPTKGLMEDNVNEAFWSSFCWFSLKKKSCQKMDVVHKYMMMRFFGVLKQVAIT